MLTAFTTFHDKGHLQQFFIGKNVHNNLKILQSMLKKKNYYLKSKIKTPSKFQSRLPEHDRAWL